MVALAAVSASRSADRPDDISAYSGCAKAESIAQRTKFRVGRAEGRRFAQSLTGRSQPARVDIAINPTQDFTDPLSLQPRVPDPDPACQAGTGARHIARTRQQLRRAIEQDRRVIQPLSGDGTLRFCEEG